MSHASEHVGGRNVDLVSMRIRSRRWTAAAAGSVIAVAMVGGSASAQSPAAGAHQPKNGTQWVVGWTPLSDPIDESRIAFDKGIQEGIEAAGGKYLYCSP